MISSFKSSSRGNHPELWSQLLDFLDEKLQLGLLEKLENVRWYSIEDEKLKILPGNEQDFIYFMKHDVSQQLRILSAVALDKESIECIICEDLGDIGEIEENNEDMPPEEGIEDS